MKALLTGSRAYGTPTDKSDVDVVMLAETDAEWDALGILVVEVKEPPLQATEHDPLQYSSQPIRLGNLNIILIGDEELFNIWKQGTELLMEYSPVTREVAVVVLSSLRCQDWTIEKARGYLESKPLVRKTEVVVEEVKELSVTEIGKMIDVSKGHPAVRLSPFWITTTSRSYCVEAESEEAALEWAEENKIGKETVMNCQCLLYPALPRLGKKSICPAFCDHPTSCAGHSSCPRNYACSE